MELRDPRPPALTDPAPGAAARRPAPGAAADARRIALVAPRLALLAGPAVLAFHAGGYFEGPRLVAAILAWALVAVLALASPVAPVLAGRPALVAVGGLAALTAWAALSTRWAPLDGPAGDDLSRDALYLGALVAGVLAWRGPRGWARAVEPALAAGVLVVIAYGLSGRLLPGVIELERTVSANGRLEQPLTYWNATGALAAIGLVLAARLAGDRTRPDLLRVAAAAGAVPVAVGLYLSYSRGALAAAGVGLLVLSLLAPTWAQLRASAVVLEAGAVAAIVADRLPGVSSLQGSASDRAADGALALSVVLAAAILAGAVQTWGCRVEATERARIGPLPLGRGGRVALWCVALALAAAPYAAALSDRDGNPAAGATAQRLDSLGSNRYAYWRVAARTWAEHPVAGVGAGGFRVEWLRERPYPEAVRDAHNLYLETLAELGVVGLLALLTLLAGVVAATRRVLRDDPALASGPAAALVVWALHAGVDWDWEMPALTLVAVVLAGLLLSRSPVPPSGSSVRI